MKTKIRCGCGLYCADSLDEYDQHLGEHVAQDDGNILLYMQRTSAETLFEEHEIARMNAEDGLLRGMVINYNV